MLARKQGRGKDTTALNAEYAAAKQKLHTLARSPEFVALKMTARSLLRHLPELICTFPSLDPFHGVVQGVPVRDMSMFVISDEPMSTGRHTLIKVYPEQSDKTPQPAESKQSQACVLKVFQWCDEPQIRREIEVLQKLHHPNIVPLLGVCRENTQWSLQFPFFPFNLRLWLQERSTREESAEQKEARILDLMRGVAKGLSHLHYMGVLHRDLTPENILVDSCDVPYITDFETARTRESSTNSSHTLVVGTRGYIAPEVFHTGHSSASGSSAHAHTPPHNVRITHTTQHTTYNTPQYILIQIYTHRPVRIWHDSRGGAWAVLHSAGQGVKYAAAMSTEIPSHCPPSAELAAPSTRTAT